MMILHRYVLWSVLGACGAAVGVFAFVLLTGNAIRDLLGLLATGQMEWLTAVKLLGLLLPFVVSYALPLGMLTGILLVLGRLSAQQEITAMRTAGLGLFRIATPVFFLSCGGVALAVAINFHYAPRAKTAYTEELSQAVRNNPLNFIVQRTFVRDFPGIVLYVGERHGHEMRDFWIWQLDDQRRVTRFIRAESGSFEFDVEVHALRLVLERGQSEFRNRTDPENFETVQPAVSFGRATLLLPLDRILGRESFRQKLSWMTFSELEEEKRRLANEPGADAAADLVKVRMTIQEKFAMGFSVFSFALVGVPLGVKLQRRETSANLGLALILAFGYYFSMIIISWLDRFPQMRPELLLWTPNIAFQILGVWLFARIDRK